MAGIREPHKKWWWTIALLLIAEVKFSWTTD